jgi:hypothetical protein
MKVCSWAAGCAQEISNEAEHCGYHEKVSGGLLGESGEAAKVAARRLLKRQLEAPGRRDTRLDG